MTDEGAESTATSETGDEWGESTATAETGDGSAASHPTPIIELREVWKVYDTGSERVEALRGVDFAVRPGEFVAVMGPSGSGKSTMLHVVGLLDSATAGTVLLDGRDVTDLSDREMTDVRKHYIGFVFQNFHLIPTLTALENVELPTLFGSHPAAEERARELLNRVGLASRVDHRPDQLSGGQKQRVAIARALVNGPRLLLADEPTGNLDRKTGRSVLEEFARIKTEEGVAIVAVTHDPQVAAYADRTVTIVDGVVHADTADGGATAAVGVVDAWGAPTTGGEPVEPDEADAEDGPGETDIEGESDPRGGAGEERS
ncbi:MAG: ABC transporter ATP-binding protein [Haloferacaceae archaeon]